MSATNEAALDAVDIIIPCFNDGAYLTEAIESLGSERSTGKGVIVVNDGSTDQGTITVLEGLRERGFQVIDTANEGLAAARNTGVMASKAPFVLFLDSDNRIEPSYPERALEVFVSHPSVAVVFSDKLEFGLRTGVEEQRVPTLAEELVGNRVDACAVVRRSALDTVGGFDVGMREGYEDWELWIRLMIGGHRFHHIPEPLFHYRVRAGSLLGRASDPAVRERILDHIVRKHAEVFAANVVSIVPELHRIQANDRARWVTSEELRAKLADDLLTSQQATESIRSRLSSVEAELGTIQGRLVDVDAMYQRSLEAWRSAEHELKEHLSTLRVEAEQSEAEKRELAGAIERIRAEVERAEKEKEALSIEAHRLVGETDKLMQALSAHREHTKALQGLIGQYEERIKAIESSKLFRLKKAYNKMRALLRTSSGTSKTGFRWMKRITFLISEKGRRIVRRFLAKFFRAMYLMTEDQPVRILLGSEQMRSALVASGSPYEQWMAKHFARTSDLNDHREQIELFRERPLVSVVMPVYDPPLELLDAAIRSVVDQVYGEWELCIADDLSPNKEVRECLERWMIAEPRVRVVFRKENGHISKASNSALDLATGEYMAFMDHDDLLAPDALYHVVKRINLRPDTDIVYTDEDKVDEEGRHSDAHFKPQWCPDHLLSRNYFGHLVVMRSSLVREIGGFREGFEGSQDYDIILRATEKAKRIEHIPRVLYHWRIHAASAAQSEEVKPYAYQAARKALTEAMDRRQEPAEVSFLHGYRGYGIRFTSPLKGKVSVIIPTKDKTDVLATCVHSLFNLTDHPDFEVVVVSNNSKEPAFFAFMKEMERLQPDRFRWYEHNIPFNFSALMDFGVSKSTGDQILFLNNDTEVIHGDWMRIMHSWSQRPSIGAVGVKLLYHNDTIQHAGVIIGLGGVAGHTWVGYHKDGPGYFNYINTVNNNSAVTAACMMVERIKLERIGGWEEEFTVEYNDVDLCLRLREAGYNNVYVPDVSLYHYESLTRGHPHMTKESYERHLREVGLFKERWSDYVKDDPCYNPNLSRGVHDFQIAL
ncbi:MAG: glycosyltransferase [Flavobacteriales bacterium]|nr:glycosyltransferase [Flavobacteriales bacterium]